MVFISILGKEKERAEKKERTEVKKTCLDQCGLKCNKHH